MNFTVIIVFESDDLLRLLIAIVYRFLQLQGIIHQDAQGRSQLIQGRLRQRLIIYPRQNRLTAFQHPHLHIELEPRQKPSLPLAVTAAQVSLFSPPVSQGAGRDAQRAACQRDIAFVALKLVQGIDFRIQAISPRHPKHSSAAKKPP